MGTNENIKALLGYLGVYGAICVGLGEFLLHYSPQVLGTVGPYIFFSHVSLDHLYYGHFLSIIGLPFYYAGYLHIYMMLRPGNNRLAKLVLGLGFIAFSVGGVWIGSRAFLGTIVHLHEEMPLKSFDAIISHYEGLLEILVHALRIFILLLSVIFSWTIFNGGTLYNKWMAIFNPISVLLFFVLIGTVIPWIGKYTLPILMNITHIVIFSLSIFQNKTNEKS